MLHNVQCAALVKALNLSPLPADSSELLWLGVARRRRSLRGVCQIAADRHNPNLHPPRPESLCHRRRPSDLTKGANGRRLWRVRRGRSQAILACRAVQFVRQILNMASNCP